MNVKLSSTLPTVEQLPLPHVVKTVVTPKWKAAAKGAENLYAGDWHSGINDELNTGKLWGLWKYISKKK